MGSLGKTFSLDVVYHRRPAQGKHGLSWATMDWLALTQLLSQRIQRAFETQYQLHAAVDVAIRLQAALNRLQQTVGTGTAIERFKSRPIVRLGASRGAVHADGQGVIEIIDHQTQHELRAAALRRRFLAGFLDKVHPLTG